MIPELNPWSPLRWSIPEALWNDSSLPLVTLGVLNYNRKEELRSTLDVMTRVVEYPNVEIILIDNGSTDGSLEMVRSVYPTVVIHEVGKNEGVSARNHLIPLAHGKYLFNFDDDTCPGTPATIYEIVQFLETNPGIDVLSTQYYQPVTGINETKGWSKFALSGDARAGYNGIFLVEGGICFRLASLKRTAGYDPDWMGQEGMELGIQFYKLGMEIRLCTQFLTLHFIANSGRPSGRRAYVNSRQTIWMLAKHWPTPMVLLLMTLIVPRRILAMLMHQETARENIRGLFHGFTGIRPFIAARPKLKAAEALRLRKFYLFLLRWA